MSFVFEGSLPVSAPLAMFSRLNAYWHKVSNDNGFRPKGALVRPRAGQILPWVGKVDPVALSEGVGDAIRARLVEVGAQLIAQSVREGPVTITTASDRALLLSELAELPDAPAPSPEPAPEVDLLSPSLQETLANPPVSDEPSVDVRPAEPDQPQPAVPPLAVEGLFRHLEAAIERIEATRQSARQAFVDKLTKPIGAKRPDWLFGREGPKSAKTVFGGSLIRLADRRRSDDNAVLPT